MESTLEKPDGVLPGLHALGFDPPEGMTFSYFQGCMSYLRTLEAASPWALGDLLNWADTQPKEIAEAAIQYASQLYVPQTCTNRKSITKRFKKHERWGFPLTFSHHAAVAYMDPAVRQKLLEQAQAGDWSVSELLVAKRGGEIAAPKEKSECPNCFPRFQHGYREGLREAIDILEQGGIHGSHLVLLDSIKAKLEKNLAGD